MILATGVDLVEIERFRLAMERHGKRLLERIFTPQELVETKGLAASLAVRFAGKEAAAKALKTGIGPVRWREIEILRGPNREPELHLHGSAKTLARQMGLYNWSISLSHTDAHAIAVVVALGDKSL